MWRLPWFEKSGIEKSVSLLCFDVAFQKDCNFFYGLLDMCLAGPVWVNVTDGLALPILNLSLPLRDPLALLFL